jgi:hypothetical protein
MYKYYVCQTCGGENTPHQAGRDFPKLCYFCHGGFLVYITVQNLKNIMEMLYAKTNTQVSSKKNTSILPI